MKPKFTADALRERLSYDPETGIFTRRRGKRVGSTLKDGYQMIGVMGVAYRAHRLAWLYVHGEWPTMDIDHINGDKADNRLVNLRQLRSQENTQNQKRAHARNKSGYMGVHWVAKQKQWEASIGVDYATIKLGYFDTPAEAHAAYLAAKARMHPGWSGSLSSTAAPGAC